MGALKGVTLPLLGRAASLSFYLKDLNIIFNYLYLGLSKMEGHFTLPPT